MGFFACISRRPKADSEPLQKRDSAADFLPVKVRILIPRPPGEAAESGQKWQGAGDLLEKSWQNSGPRERDQTRYCRAPRALRSGGRSGPNRRRKFRLL